MRDSLLPARDLVLKDLVLSGNITHSKHDRFTKKITLALNGELSPFKTRSFFLIKQPCCEWVMLLFKTRSFQNESHTGRILACNLLFRNFS